MTEMHVIIPDDVAAKVVSEARERGVSTDEVVVEALREHVPSEPSGIFGFIGIGRAKPGFSTRAAEEAMEAEGFV
jgi:hypothetical protein